MLVDELAPVELVQAVDADEQHVTACALVSRNPCIASKQASRECHDR
jgi:hypothetical protein